MIEAIGFKTRARTIDHLGREQIADCPTAISELWKNAYDAYARNVSMDVFDGDFPVAAIADDGHGMTRQEFVEKWLVVGTESKATAILASEEDRDGLQPRIRQGQKGIGRLSIAALGSILLIISKRRGNKFVASLIDWRLFENPYLLLDDIRLPIVEFDNKEELLSLIPQLSEVLVSNIWGDNADEGRNSRLEAAWTAFDRLTFYQEFQDLGGGTLTEHEVYEAVLAGKLNLLYEAGAIPLGDDNPFQTNRAASKSIEQAALLISSGEAFTKRHLDVWPAWNGKSDKGTIMMSGLLSFDLTALINDGSSDTQELRARDRFKETLNGFTDPYSADVDRHSLEFDYKASTWIADRDTLIVGDTRPVDYHTLQEMEHYLEGTVDNDGVFRGRVKAFGIEIDTNLTLIPKIRIPKRSNSIVGPFSLIIGAFEGEPKNSTFTEERVRALQELGSQYGGLLIYRDQLRVLPYGREDSDFFEIETRRSKHAGREYWNKRRMFGRVAIGRAENPNLKDKAGREGIIDNRPAKAFRDIVIYILMETARRYFGSSSELRQKTLPQLNERYEKQRASENQRKRRAKERKRFTEKLSTFGPIAKDLVSHLEDLNSKLNEAKNAKNELEINRVQSALPKVKETLSKLVMGATPHNMGRREEEYREYSNNKKIAQAASIDLAAKISAALEEVSPKPTSEILYSAIKSNGSTINAQISRYAKQTKALLDNEIARLEAIASDRRKAYEQEIAGTAEKVEAGQLPLSDAIQYLESTRLIVERENAEIFEPYAEALSLLQENIDVASLASFSDGEIQDLRKEMDRINSLAQLGIAVEITGHELNAMSSNITRGLNRLPAAIHETKEYELVKSSFDALKNRLDFLSPLKLSGDRVRSDITGQEIVDHLNDFFEHKFRSNNLELTATDAFLGMKLFDFRPMIYPVFLNLVNNAVYWTGQNDTEQRQILLDYDNGQIFVSDTGPGVAEEDIKDLFTLFFTKRIHGGRGVGLYLCRANLTSSNHKISYVVDQKEKRLPGANFKIQLSENSL